MPVLLHVYISFNELNPPPLSPPNLHLTSFLSYIVVDTGGWATSYVNIILPCFDIYNVVNKADLLGSRKVDKIITVSP